MLGFNNFLANIMVKLHPLCLNKYLNTSLKDVC